MTTEVLVARWSAAELARILGAELEGNENGGFDAVTTDSRESGEGMAFFALDGTRARGAEFAPAAFGAGCSVVVVPADWIGDVPAGRAALRVPDPLAALGKLAAHVRNEWTCPVIAVTGSVGKTTVKEMAARVLEGDRAVLRSPGNFNTIEGVARTIVPVTAAPDAAVLEVGASLPGEIARLAEIVRPTGACVTNVGPAHLEGFGSMRAVAREKLSLLRAVPPGGLRVIDGDDPSLLAAAGDLPDLHRCGLQRGNDLRATDVTADADGSTYRVEGGPAGRLGVPGAHQVRNALFALAVGQAHGVPLEEGVERLRTFSGVPGRMATLTVGGVLVVDDAYNANPSSMRAALDWFGALAVDGRKAVVLGDMLELGPDSPGFHRRVGRQVAETGPGLSIFVGEGMRAGFEEASRRSTDNERLRHVADSEEAARLVADWVAAGDAVLVKGSRGVHLERVLAALGVRSERDAV